MMGAPEFATERRWAAPQAAMRRRDIPCNLTAASAMRSSARICWNPLDSHRLTNHIAKCVFQCQAVSR
jgi:hypothetical protein